MPADAASVAKRVREIGTLKALGWSRFAVVRQISAETLVQGLLGGLIGAAAGIAASQAINATGWSLKASVASAAASGPVTSGPAGFGLGRVGGQPATASELVHITTAVSGQTLLLAVALALLGGLAAGMVGGLRAARLRPGVALRTID